MITFNRHRWIGVVLTAVFVLSVFVPAVSAQDSDENKLTIPLDGMEVLQTSSSITRVVTGKSNIVNVKVINSREIAIFGLETGVTTLHIWTDRGLRQDLISVEEVSSMSVGDDFRSVFTRDDTGDQAPDDMQMRVFTPEYRDVSEFENYITELLGEDGRVVLSDQPSGKIFVVGRTQILDKIEDLIERLDVPGEEKVYTKRIVMENRPVTQVSDQIEEMLSEDGSQVIDRETNSVLVVDRVSKVNTIEDYVENIDVPTVKQVRIKTRFVEMSEDVQEQLGIDWTLPGSADGDILEADFSSQSGLQLDVNPTGGAASDFTAAIDALESEGLLNLISSPSVMTRNQQQAQLEILNQQSYLAGCNVDNAGDGAQTVTPDVQTVEDGIDLSVTPLIGKNDIIQLDIEPQLKLFNFNDDLTQSSDCGPIQFPNVETRSAQLNVAIKDGQTLVIGGLSRREETNNSSSVPGFSQIPLLGHLFSHKNVTVNDQDITIFITTKIVDYREDDAAASRDVPDTGANAGTVKKKVTTPDL